MNYYIHQRYQDSGWEKMNEGPYSDLRTAVTKCVEYASQSIIYGMVRLVDENHNVLKEWGAGSTTGLDLTAAAYADFQSITKAKEDKFYYVISLETEPGSNLYEPALTVTPNAESTTIQTLNSTDMIAAEISKRYPGSKVTIADNSGNPIRTMLYTGEHEPKPAPEPAPEPEPAKAETWKAGSFAEQDEEDEDDEEVGEFPDLLPEKLRVVGLKHQGQFWITTGCLDALIIEMQLTNARHLKGCEDVDVALESVREWLTAAEARLRAQE